MCRGEQNGDEKLYACSQVFILVDFDLRLFFHKRELGINVADYGETIFYLTEIWTQYLEGKVPIKEVIDEYTKLGFQANQDFPGNVYWEELFNASPNAKVILTVRDNADVWNKSFLSFLRQVIFISKIDY